MERDALLQRINDLSTEELVRLAKALADGLPAAELEAFEMAPAAVSVIVENLCSLADLSPESFSTLDEQTVVRRVLADYAGTVEGDSTLTQLLPHLADETMVVDFDMVALGVPIILALGGLVFIEVDNAGPAGRVRWRFRLGRREGQDPNVAKDLLRAWLLRVGGERPSLPPSSDSPTKHVKE